MIPLFLDGDGGRVFGLYHPPAPDVGNRGDNEASDILFLPPFAEELNRSRHMIARQARALAAQGKGVFILDLYGTGDSAGRFEDADWDIWLQNIKSAIDWLQNRGRTAIDIWAMRTGALLAADAINRNIIAPSKLILWMPVGNGDTFISQFLRIRMAASLGEGPDKQETTNALRNRLKQGEIIEVGGYGLNGKLAESISAQRLGNIKIPAETAVHWLDIAAIEPPALSPAAIKAIDGWKSQGIRANGVAVSGPPFWTLQEPEWADDLIIATTKAATGEAS